MLLNLGFIRTEKSKKDGKPVVVRLKVPISGSNEFNDLTF